MSDTRLSAFEATDLQGRKMRLAEPAGKVLLILVGRDGQVIKR